MAEQTKNIVFSSASGGLRPPDPPLWAPYIFTSGFFSSPVPIPDYCLLSHWSIWFLPTPTLLFVIPLINLVSPYTHITVCYPTDQFGFSLHPHYCLLSHWSIWFLPTPTLLFVIPLINLVSPYTHITVCNPLINLVSPYTHITVCYPTDQLVSPYTHITVCYPLINLVSPYTHITVCNPTDQFGFSLHPHYCL